MEYIALLSSRMRAAVSHFLPSVSCQWCSSECHVPAVNGLPGCLLPAAAARPRADYRLFVLACLVMKSQARRGKEELLAKTEHLYDPFPVPFRPNWAHTPVILPGLTSKHLKGSEPCMLHFFDQRFPSTARSPPAYVLFHLSIMWAKWWKRTASIWNLNRNLILFGPLHIEP